jgi:hypothetical protein
MSGPLFVIKYHDCDIYLMVSSGEFFTVIEEKELRADTLKALYEKINKTEESIAHAPRKQLLPVEIILLQKESLFRGDKQYALLPITVRGLVAGRYRATLRVSGAVSKSAYIELENDMISFASPGDPRLETVSQRIDEYYTHHALLEEARKALHAAIDTLEHVEIHPTKDKEETMRLEVRLLERLRQVGQPQGRTTE